MTQTIVITSGKGGVGKTNISVNTAIEFAQRNYRTCLFDADLGLANVNILLGINPESTLDDYIFGDKNLDEIILQTEFGVDVIPGSSGIENMANLDQENISDLVSSLSQIKGYDYFLIDTSSGISRGVIAFCIASTETIIVITSESTSLTDAYALLKVMAINGYTGTVKILVNKSPSIPEAKETYNRFEEVVNRHLPIKIAPAGIILNDPNIEIATTKQEPVLILSPESIASQCIKALVSNLLKSGPEEQKEGDFSDFWQRYFDFSHLHLQQPYKTVTPTEHQAEPQPVSSADKIPPEMAKSASYPEPIAIDPLSKHGGIFKVTGLASPTPILSKAIELHAKGELTQERLLDIFSCDPALMTRALQIIYGTDPEVRQAKRVTTRHQLVEELGTEVLTNLLNTTTIQKGFALPSPDSAQLTISFWAQSYTCAILAENIASFIGYPFPEEAFIAGLVHNIGRLALQTAHPEVYEHFSKTFQHEETLLDMEQRLFKMTHAEIGANALREWHFDSFLVDAVRYHMEPLAKVKTAFNLVQIVFLACRLSQKNENEAETHKLGKALFELSPAQLQSLIEQAGDTTRKLAERYHIPLAKEERNKTEETQISFRKQAMEYSILQNVLPSRPSTGELPEIIHSVFQAFDILFSIKPAFCLMPDSQNSFLKAVEYPDCFGWGTLDDIHFSLTWEQSLVVKSFIAGELKTAMKGDNDAVLSLADLQLLRSLGTQGFVCVPMIAHKLNKGIIVFGIQETQLEKIHSLLIQLEQFGAQAAKNIINVKKL